MPETLLCFDQWGRTVRLEESIWLTKISIPGRIPVNCLAQVSDTITALDCVTHDKLHQNRECYYKAGVLPHPQDRTYLKVVAEFVSSDTSKALDGFVVTAFPVGRIHSRETQKWP